MPARLRSQKNDKGEDVTDHDIEHRDTKSRPLLSDAEKRSLLTFDTLELWMQDNHYILSGYRAMSRSYRTSLRSILYIHNETINIWTHLVPGAVLCSILLSLGLCFYLGYEIDRAFGLQQGMRYASVTRQDVAVLCMFLIGSLSMFSASWFYHTVSNHSSDVSKFWNKLDYIGIICMILGSFIPSVYYGHYCRPSETRFYLLLLGSLGVLTFFFTIMDRFRTPGWRPYRAGMFIGLGLSAVIPVFGALLKDGFKKVDTEMSLRFVIVQGALYILGAVIYACRIPEKYYPHRFDIFGASHQIFHICVVLAGVTHAIGVFHAFDYRHGILHGQCV